MTINKTFFALVFFLAGCGGSADEPVEDSGEEQGTTQGSGETEDTAQGSGQTGDAFELSEGVWVGTYSLLENECDAEPSTGDLELVVSNLDGAASRWRSNPSSMPVPSKVCRLPASHLSTTSRLVRPSPS